MSSPLIIAILAAISGATTGALVKIIIDWYHQRKVLTKVIKTGLYHEIEHHSITDLEKDEDGSPNFVLTGFQNYFYSNNISNITMLLDEIIVQMLTHYYASLKLVVDYQEMLSKVHSEIESFSEFDSITKNLKPKFPIIPDEAQKLGLLISQKEAIKDVLRVSLATAQYTRLKLLSLLKNAFKKDPSERQFIDVLPEHQEWWERIQKEVKA